jgi:phage portal protein BeeE
MSRDRGGRLTALMPIDGATIKPVIDDWGRVPEPYVENSKTVYPVAFQQILKGYPAVNYSVRDLLYRPRNIRVNHAYGFSPVEQVITSVNIALRRQAFILDYFTQGNIPDSLIGVPENWTPDQIASYQKYWDAYFDGDLARRRRAKFVPGGVAKTFVQTKEPDLKSPFDDWLARIVCFAFSVSPQALIQQMNRATAQTQKETSEEEGLAPVLAWGKFLTAVSAQLAEGDFPAEWARV